MKKLADLFQLVFCMLLFFLILPVQDLNPPVIGRNSL